MDWQESLKYSDKLCWVIIVGATLYFNQNVVVKREVFSSKFDKAIAGRVKNINFDTITVDGKPRYFVDAKDVITTIPFVKNHEFNYARLLPKNLQSYCIHIIHHHCNFYCNGCFKRAQILQMD